MFLIITVVVTATLVVVPVNFRHTSQFKLSQWSCMIVRIELFKPHDSILHRFIFNQFCIWKMYKSHSYICNTISPFSLLLLSFLLILYHFHCIKKRNKKCSTQANFIMLMRKAVLFHGGNDKRRKKEANKSGTEELHNIELMTISICNIFNGVKYYVYIY